MNIWVLGKDGLVGGEFLKVCAEQRIRCLATNREQADISDLQQLLKIASRNEVTHLVNCAAYTNVDRAEAEEEIAYRINAQGPENLGIVARKTGARLLHLSTDYVFDGEKKIPLVETDLCNPSGVYAQSKWEGEKRLLDQFPTACILRTSWVFGKGGKSFISSLLSFFRMQEEVRVVQDQCGRLTYCRDLAETMLALLCHSGIFHFANEGEVSRFQVAEELLARAQERGLKLACRRLEPVSSQAFPTPAKRPAYSVLATDKIERLLNRKPRFWKEVIAEYLHHES